MTVALDGPTDSTLAIDCQNLSFAFSEGSETVLKDINLELKRGSRCLLVGANGGASYRISYAFADDHFSREVDSSPHPCGKATYQDKGL